MRIEGYLPEGLEPVRIEQHGLGLVVPSGWEGRIRRQAAEESGARTFPVLHASTVPLTAQRADYGGGVVERLGRSDVFVSLVEFGPDQAGTALFPVVDEPPTLAVAMFHRNQLQRRIRGQAGVQRFFTYRGRPFCLYVVLGSIANAVELVTRANEMLAGLSVEGL